MSTFWVSVAAAANHTIDRIGNIRPTDMNAGLEYCFNGICKVAKCTGITYAISACGDLLGRIACLQNKEEGPGSNVDYTKSLDFPCPPTAPGEDNPLFSSAMGVTMIVGLGSLAYFGYKKYQSHQKKHVDAIENNPNSNHNHKIAATY